VTVYLTDDERVLAHNAYRLSYSEISDPAEELRDMLEPGEYQDAMTALGLEAIIDL
jgi:hypothetical protein